MLFILLFRHLLPSTHLHTSSKVSFVFLCFFGISHVLLVLISPVFGCILFVPNNFVFFFFFIKFRSIPGVTLGSSATDYFLCVQSMLLISGSIFKYIYSFCNVFFRVHLSHPYVAVGNSHIHVRIIRNSIVLFIHSHGFIMSIPCFHVIASLRLISFVPSPSVYIN